MTVEITESECATITAALYQKIIGLQDEYVRSNTDGHKVFLRERIDKYQALRNKLWDARIPDETVCA